MDRRQFLSWAGYGTIGAFAGLSATPADAKKKKKKKKRRNMRGRYQGTINVDVPPDPN